METYEQIRDRYLALTHVWHPECQTMPIHRTRQDDGSWHIEIQPDGIYALVGTERGLETDRKETFDIDDLLYWIVSSEARQRGWKFELEHRHPIDDSRRIAFSKSEEELGKISVVWANRLKAEHAAVLHEHPFRDDPFRVVSSPSA